MTWLGVALGVGIAILFLGLVFLILWLFPDESRRITVPGMQPSSNQTGNLDDITKAGSMHEFLVGLHKDFGPVASFWWSSVPTISVASAEHFKQQLELFDRPLDLFYMFEQLYSQNSIHFANGTEGRSRRQAYDKVFNFDSLGTYCGTLQKLADEMSKKWDKVDEDDHFPLSEHMGQFTSKAAMAALLGDGFTNDKEALVFRKNHKVVWEDIDRFLTHPLIPTDSSPRAMNFLKAVVTLRDQVERAEKTRKIKGTDNLDFLLIDAIMKFHSDQEKRVADSVTYLIIGFHTTCYFLTWCIYYLCTHEDVQEKVYTEITTVLGSTENVTVQNMGKLKYLRQVLDETLRCAQVIPYAARCSEVDTELDGHKVPAGTPVIHALGVSMRDENIWPAPTVFDPDRFSEKRSKGRPSIAFSPFGFAGRRQCPGYRFTYLEATIMLVTALRKVKFLLVPGQDVLPMYGFVVTRPKDEVWYKVAKRA